MSETFLSPSAASKGRSMSDPTFIRSFAHPKKHADSETETSGIASPRSDCASTTAATFSHANSVTRPSPNPVLIGSLEDLVALFHLEKGTEANTFAMGGKQYKINIVRPDFSPPLSLDLAVSSLSLTGPIQSSDPLIISSAVNLTISPERTATKALSLPLYPSPIMPEDENVPPPQTEPERQLHLAFLFSGPLVTAYKDADHVKIKPMPPLEYQKEIDQIVRNAGEACQGIKYKKAVATLDSFQQCMNEMPLALHFTGHGIKNTAFGNDRTHEGDFLVFEDDYGKAQYVSCQVLKGILKACPRQPEFVFVSSCHSRLVGDVFKSAGAKHVICVKRSEKILDEVAVLFAQEFYKAFFMPHGTVCTAFEVASTKLMAKTAEHVDHTPFLTQGDEHTKFELLIRSDYAVPHSCSNPHPIPVGQPISICPPVEYHDIPSKVEHFVGRKTELYNIITLIHDSRIVTIKGLPGIGKTSIAKTLAHFFMERGTFRNGIIYISARGVESTDAFITQLYISAKCATESATLPAKDKLTQILTALSEMNVLLLIDNAEDPLNKDKAQFLNTIHILLSQLPRVKILVTSRTHLGSLPDLTEKVYNLLPLDPRSSVLLLEKRAPRQITSGEIDELLHEEVGPANNPKGGDEGGNGKFEEHKLMQLLAGHPQAISLAAALLEGRTLKKIYQQLMSSSLRANEMHSLKISIALSIDRVQTLNPDSVRFFKMMGLFPGGACSEELKTIWGAGYEEHITNLQNVSLLVRKESGEERYWLLPFMADYALNYLKEHDISDIFQRGCEFYAQKLEAIFMTDSTSSGADNNLIKDEPNIVAFLGYANNENKENAPVPAEDETAATVGLKEKQPSEIVLEGIEKELVPSREAAETLGTEESKLTGRIYGREMVGGRRRKSETFQEFSLPPMERQHSENSYNGSSSVVPQEKTRKMSLFGVEEEKHMHTDGNNISSNDSVDPEGGIGVTTDEELSSLLPARKKPPSTAPKPQTVMTGYGRLLVYYCANLLMAHRYNDANKTALNYIESPLISHDTLAQGNLYKLLGLVADKMQDLEKQKDYTASKAHYCAAKHLFFKSDSYLGQAACLVALGEIERQQGEYEKAKWSYENALRHYAVIKHSYGVALSHGALALIKDKLALKKQSKEHVIQARLVREAQAGGNQKHYIGGIFVSRWEGGPSAFIVEVAKVGSEMVTDNKKRTSILHLQSHTKRRFPDSNKRAIKDHSVPRVEEIPTVLLKKMNPSSRTHRKTHINNTLEIFSIEEEEASKELTSGMEEKKKWSTKRPRGSFENSLKPRGSILGGGSNRGKEKVDCSLATMKKQSPGQSKKIRGKIPDQSVGLVGGGKVMSKKGGNRIQKIQSDPSEEGLAAVGKKVTKGVKGMKGKLAGL